MLAPLEWLKEFVVVDIEASKLAEQMTMSGSKVESLQKLSFANPDNPNNISEEEVIEFEITPNRPDCLSIIGIAREVAATTNMQMKVKKSGKLNILRDDSCAASVDVTNSSLCPRYCALIVKNINVRPSPAWMQKRLSLAGIRPINNIVDITNYVMLEVGQPMHAFDMDKVFNANIVVRLAFEGEKIITLDGKTRELSTDTLVIADTEKALGIAGVMGGAFSEITESTKNIIIESANFNSINIRLTSKKLGLRTDASSRFEKGIDIENSKIAMERAIELIEQLDAGTVVNGIIDVSSMNNEQRLIKIDFDKINRLLSLNLPTETIISILEKLSIKVESTEESYIAIIPSFRADIEGNADLAEEVARIYGFDKIPLNSVGASNSRGSKTKKQKLIDKVKEVLVGAGFFEISTYSFTSPNIYSTIGYKNANEWPSTIKIANPLGEDQSVMRTTLLPNILEVLSRNYNRGQSSARIFETGVSFIPKDEAMTELPNEVALLSMALFENGADFYFIKGKVELLCEELGILGNLSFERASHNAFHPGRSAVLECCGSELGIIGEIHPQILKNYNLEGLKVLAAEINLNNLLDLANTNKVFTPLPKYPSVKRDLAIVVDKTLPAKSVEDIIRNCGGDLLCSVELFDIYEGAQIPQGTKSMAYSLQYRSSDRTLKDEEVIEVHNKITESIANVLGAKLR